MKRQPKTKLSLSVDALTGESVNLDRHAIGERIKAARNALGITQDGLSHYAGSTSKRGLQDNEKGVSMPGGQMIGALVMARINANWLLTGEGPMLLADPQTQPAQAITPPGLDMPRFLLAIEAVEEGLEAANRTMTPAKKAELFLAVYDMMEEPTITKERVLKLVKLAA